MRLTHLLNCFRRGGEDGGGLLHCFYLGGADKTVFGGEKDEAGLSLLTKQLFPTVSRRLTSKCVSI